MARTRLRRHLGYNAGDLYRLAVDVEKYPRFINLLTAVRISNRRAVTAHHMRFEADAKVSYKFISETFRSLVDCYANEHRIVVSKPSQSGAVKILSVHWVFHPLSDGTTLVDFDVEVELKSKMLNGLMRSKFDKASEYIMKLFEQRASVMLKPVAGGDLNMDTELDRLGLDKRVS